MHYRQRSKVFSMRCRTRTAISTHSPASCPSSFSRANRLRRPHMLSSGGASPTRSTADHTAHHIESSCISYDSIAPTGPRLEPHCCKRWDVFRQEDTSRTGKWALVTLLRSTGDPEDAEQARVLTEDLTSDQDPALSVGGSLKSYCATDPCDPTSERPDNMDRTAQRYRSIDVSKLRLSRNVSDRRSFSLHGKTRDGPFRSTDRCEQSTRSWPDM